MHCMFSFKEKKYCLLFRTKIAKLYKKNENSIQKLQINCNKMSKNFKFIKCFCGDHMKTPE